MNRRLFLLLALCGFLQGCSTLEYYAQSVGGHLSLMGKSRPIGTVIEDPSTPERLKVRLQKIREMRRFAVESLRLPENGSYDSYADLNREAVVWSLVAAPEFSVQAKTWCYPFIGCASYRGYFDKADAERHADDLRDKGLDVAVEPVPAYSTLGWFDDPLPSTVIDWPEEQVAGLMFHELAHQLIYVKDDSTFNESFASAIEQVGVERWLEREGDQAAITSWRDTLQREEAFVELLLSTREELQGLYAQSHDKDEMRRRKAAVFRGLERDYKALRQRWGGYGGYDRWFSRGLNNARLASIATYEQWVPAFLYLLRRERVMEDFYAACRRLARLPYHERQQALDRLLVQSRQAAGR
ncbi:MAG: aminopeptidase [Sedimenticola sp.]